MSGINGTKPKFEQQTLQTERDPETSRYGAPNCQHFHNFLAPSPFLSNSDAEPQLTDSSTAP